MQNFRRARRISRKFARYNDVDLLGPALLHDLLRGLSTVILLGLACNAQDKQSCGFVHRDIGVSRVCIPLADCGDVQAACIQARSQALDRQDKKPKYACPSSYNPALTNFAMWVERPEGVYCISVPQTCGESDSQEKCYEAAAHDVAQGVASHSCQRSGYSGSGACTPRHTQDK